MAGALVGFGAAVFLGRVVASLEDGGGDLNDRGGDSGSCRCEVGDCRSGRAMGFGRARC